MKEVEKSAKTVEEALQIALEELNASREEVKVDVLEEGKPGLLGLGGTDATVRVSLDKPEPGNEADVTDPTDAARELLEELLDKLGVDADVCIPAGGVRTLLEMLKANEKVGIVGIGYDPKVDHVQHGCALIRTDLAQKFTLTEKSCMCRQFCAQTEEMGYEVRHVPAMSARHMKHER